MENTINIAIADEQPLIRQGIKSILASYGGFDVTIDASNGVELVEHLAKASEPPDICILGISMEGLNGYDTLVEIKKNWADMKVLVFSFFYDEFIIYEMIKNGANGYLEKTSTSKQLINALATIYYNNYHFPEPLAKKIFDRYKRDVIPKITRREMEFLRHCCSELHYKEIADKMRISPRTIEAFRDALFSKLNIKSRTGLVMFAFQNGIVSLNVNRKTMGQSMCAIR